MSTGIRSSGNTVRWLLGAEQFLPELLRQLEALEQAEPSRSTWLRLACWELSALLRLPDSREGSTQTLGELLRRISARHPVQLVLWSPRPQERLLDVHGRLPDPTLLRGLYEGHLDVRLRASRAGFGTRNHQQLLLVSVDGRHTALVGGPPLVQGSEDGSRQEVGVLLQGPATQALEAEWLRLWGDGPSPRSTPLPPRAASDAGPGDGVDVTVAVTRAEAPRARGIRERVLQELGRARESIYMEGSAVTDPALVDALARRLAEPRPPEVILRVDPPLRSGGGPSGHLLRQAAWTLAFHTCEALTLADGRVLSRGDFALWRTEGTRMVWGRSEAEASSARLLDVRYFAGARPVLFRAPGPRQEALPGLDSGLALFDGEVAVIGSASWTGRAMTSDGELSVFIHHGPSVRRLREELLARRPRVPLALEDFQRLSPPSTKYLEHLADSTFG